MSFGGPIDSMINSHRENSKKLHPLKRMNEITIPGKKTELKFKESSIREMERWKKRISRNKKKDRMQSLLILILSIIILLSLLMWIMSADFSPVIDVID